MRKLAIIRDGEMEQCPFGLPVIFGCLNIGNVIDKLAPLDIMGADTTKEEKEQIKKANLHILMWNNPGERCKYAANLFVEKNKVQCSWGDTAAGVKETATLLGSPFYSQMFAGIGLDGLYSYPMGYMSDAGTGRNMYYSITSLNSNKADIELIKLADECLEIIINRN